MQKIKTDGKHSDDFKSNDSARDQGTSTVLAAAARLQGGAACRELGPCMPEGDWQTRYRLREKLQRHTVDQGWATHDKAAGDFDEI